MTRTALIALATLMAAIPAGPAAAQSVNGGVLDIFGDDECPTNSNGEEIYVCRRLPETERFRIPRNLRETEIAPRNESWAVRQEEALRVGEFGTGSCSAVGAGGGTGCFVRAARQSKAESRARREAEVDLPLE